MGVVYRRVGGRALAVVAAAALAASAAVGSAAADTGTATAGTTDTGTATAGTATAGTATAGTATAGTTPDGTVIGGPQLGPPNNVVSSAPGLPALPPITATSFVIADATTGQILAARNAHERLAPASTLKTLTALALLPLLDPTQTVVAANDAPSADGTKAGIVAGTTYTVDNLFTAMLMMSANDAAVALADAEGSQADTLDVMNRIAAYYQADDTVALTPDGLDAPGQSSSAYDLALIFRAGLANPAFVHYLSLRTAQFPAPKGQSFQIQTHDQLLTDYPGMVGGKNGYTVAAQASYVGAAARNGHTIIVSVMRDRPDFWPEVTAMLDWGFAVDGTIAPVGVLVDHVVPVVAEPAPQPTASPAAAAAPVAPTTAAESTVVTAEAKSRTTHAGTGVGISAVLIWSAVGAGGLFLLIALWQLAARRRRLELADDRYLNGLSRLSTVDLTARSTTSAS